MDPHYLIGDEEEEIELLGELLGDEAWGDPILGQRSALHTRVPARRGTGMRTRARQRIRQALVPQTSGVPTPGAKELVLPFEVVNFTENTAAVLNAVARPQVPFKGRRLVVEATLSGAGVGGAIGISDIRVGQKSQPVAAGIIPIGTFGAGSFGVDLALDPATPGIEITITYQLGAACGVGQTVDITTVLIGLAIM